MTKRATALKLNVINEGPLGEALEKQKRTSAPPHEIDLKRTQANIRGLADKLSDLKTMDIRELWATFEVFSHIIRRVELCSAIRASKPGYNALHF